MLYQALQDRSNLTKRGLFLAHFTVSFLQALIRNSTVRGFFKLIALLSLPGAPTGPFACS